jgi:4-carboxymuconolactone decarboxylase
MARVEDLKPETLTPEQKAIHDRIAASRSGTVRGPFAIWLRNPKIADAADKFGTTLRNGELDQRLFEIMVLVVARHWSAQYEWFAHERHAVECGIPSAVIEAIRHRRKPEFERDDERLVYELVTEMNETRTLSQETYDRAVAMLGLDLVIELITSLGFYTMVAIMLNGFDAPVPGGARPLP